MPTGLNRALQVRTADRLRAALARDERSGLPALGALSEVEQRELCQAGGGRLAAVAIRVRACVGHDAGLDVGASLDDDGLAVQVEALRKVAGMVAGHVRRTDLFGALWDETLLVLAPGLDPVGGRSLAERLRELLVPLRVELAGVQVELKVEVGAAFRCAASSTGWTTRALAAEAELQATADGAIGLATVA